MNDGKTVKKTEQKYWDSVWDVNEVPDPVSMTDPSVSNSLTRRIGDLFEDFLPPVIGEKPVIMEAGCGGSRWLPAFRTHFNYNVVGIDYSDSGCSLSEAILEKAGVEGDIHQEDVFNLPDSYKESVDVVYSIGLVEHFTPTKAIVEKLAWLVKPGGLLITIVPNMNGITGWLQRLLDKKLYNAHVPLTSDELAEACAKSDLDIIHSDYLGALHLGVANFDRKKGTFLHRVYMELTFRSAVAVSKMEDKRGAKWKHAWFSPLVACVARKK